MACIVLNVHVFLIMQTYSRRMFSLLPLPRLLSSHKMHVSKLTIRLIKSIGHQMWYREPKKLVLAVFNSKTSWKYAPIFKQSRIKRARYCLIIMIIQKYVKSMPICFARDRVCAISIARIDLQMPASKCGIVSRRNLCSAVFNSKPFWKYAPIFKQSVQ